jgi:hypothetical protein
MTDKHGFDKTQQIVPNLSLEIATMSSRSQVNSAKPAHIQGREIPPKTSADTVNAARMP